MIIAIDGPSASGKGTLAKALAKHLGFHYLDTGLLYRGLGFEARKIGVDLNSETACAALAEKLDLNAIDTEILRGEEVGALASKVAVLPKVRSSLLQLQRNFASQKPGSVLDGRDIGTVICPDAEHKFYITASVAERARRRSLESAAVDLAAIMRDIEARDARDMERATAPLKPAPDAHIIDTSDLTPAQALEKVLSLIAPSKNQA